MNREQLHDKGDDGHGVDDDHEEIGEKKEEEAAGRLTGAHGALHPSVDKENGYQRGYNNQPYEQRARFHDMSGACVFMT